MKKVSSICKEKCVCDIEEVVDNIALVNAPDGRSGLFNVKTNELVGSIGNYNNFYSSSDHYIFQEEERVIEEETTIRRKSTTNDKRKYLRFYDTKNEKMVFDLWHLIWKDYNDDRIILQNPDTGKYHIFGRIKYMKSEDNFNLEFDYAEYFCDRYGDFIFLVMKDGKKGLYSSASRARGGGIIVPMEYDDIEKKNDIIYLTKGKDKYFLWYYCDPVEIVSSPYDEITEDEKMQNLIYAKRDGYMYVFMGNSLLFKSSYSKVEYVKTIERRNDYREYIFKVTYNGKVGLISSKYDGSKSVITTLVECSYDRIENAGYNYFLYNDDKVGLYKREEYSIYDYSSYIVPPMYDKIEELTNDYYAFYVGDYCNIAKIYNHDKHEVSYSLIVDRYDPDGIVVYIKNGKYGIFASDKQGNVYKSFGYDNIVNKTGGYFELEKNGLKGMWFYHKVIIEPKYDSIQINGENKCYWEKSDELSDFNSVCLGLERNRVFTLARCFNYRSNNVYSNNVYFEYGSDTKYDDMLFLKDIMVLKKNKSIFPYGKKETYIYNYKNKLLKTFDSDVKVTYVPKKRDITPAYLVDDTYYMYRDGNFEEACTSDCTLYATAYESEYGTIVVNSYDEEEHDKKCKIIEELTNEEVNDKILGYVSEEENLLNKYPKLIRKR